MTPQVTTEPARNGFTALPQAGEGVVFDPGPGAVAPGSGA